MTVQDVVTAKIVSMLEAGQIPWHKPWADVDGQGGAYNAISGKRYSGINAMLLGFEDEDAFLTMKQANDKGGRVRKGSHAHPVVFWRIEAEKRNAAGEVTRKKSVLLRYYNVFKLSDVDGLDAAWVAKVRDAHARVKRTEVEANSAAEVIVESMPHRPSISYGGNRACYSPALDAVQMPPRDAFTATGEFYSTLFHELGHSTGHSSRLGRKDLMQSAGFGSESYSREELVAEMTAAFLCQTAGVATDGTLTNSAAYVQNWLKALKADSTMVMYAASKAKKAAQYILGQLETSEEEAQ